MKPRHETVAQLERDFIAAAAVLGVITVGAAICMALNEQSVFTDDGARLCNRVLCQC